MEICRYAKPEKTLDQSYSYLCALHGYEMGLELGHWCGDCTEYATGMASEPTEKPSRSRVPCAVCRFRPTCRLRSQYQVGCPFFSQK